MGFAWTPDPAIGVDIRLDSTADLAVTPSGDLDLIGNEVPMQNVWQATVLRLLTTVGTYFFQDKYGTRLRQFIDAPMTAETKASIEGEITDTVMSDPRVQRIAALAVTQVTNGFEVALNIVTSSSQGIGGVLTVTGD